MGERPQRIPVAPLELPDIPDRAAFHQLLQSAERRHPGDRPIHRKRDAGFLGGRFHAQRFLETRGHRLFRHDVDAMRRRRLRDLGVAGVLGAENRDIQLLRREQLAIILVFARRAGRGEGSLQIGAAAALDLCCGRRARYRVRAGDDVRATRSDEPVHQFVHMHMRKADHANAIRLLA